MSDADAIDRALDELGQLRGLLAEVWAYGNMSPLPNGLMDRVAAAIGEDPYQ